MNLFFLYQSLTSLENGKFYGRKADYVWFFIFGMLIFDVSLITFFFFFFFLYKIIKFNFKYYLINKLSK